MISKWVHLQCIFNNNWVLPIHNEINKALQGSRIKEPTEAFNEYAMSISIRLDMIIRLLNRMTMILGKISKEILNFEEDNISTSSKEGYVLEIDDDLKLDLLIDIDAFLFEINSCCELFGKYLIELYSLRDNPIEQVKVGKKLGRILKDGGADISWFRTLDDSRNFFIHSGAPYIAVDVSDPKELNLIIMKENLKSFEDSSKYITLTNLVEIREGFKKALPILQSHMMNFISLD